MSGSRNCFPMLTHTERRPRETTRFGPLSGDDVRPGRREASRCASLGRGGARCGCEDDDTIDNALNAAKRAARATRKGVATRTERSAHRGQEGPPEQRHDHDDQSPRRRRCAWHRRPRLDGEPQFVPLERGRIRCVPASDGSFRWYGLYKIPEAFGGGGTLTIRLDITDDDRISGLNRTELLRAHPVFRPRLPWLATVRRVTESNNSVLEGTLDTTRANSGACQQQGEPLRIRAPGELVTRISRSAPRGQGIGPPLGNRRVHALVRRSGGPRSSVEKSNGFLNRVSQVRFLPGALAERTADRPDQVLSRRSRTSMWPLLIRFPFSSGSRWISNSLWAAGRSRETAGRCQDLVHPCYFCTRRVPTRGDRCRAATGIRSSGPVSGGSLVPQGSSVPGCHPPTDPPRRPLSST